MQSQWPAIKIRPCRSQSHGLHNNHPSPSHAHPWSPRTPHLIGLCTESLTSFLTHHSQWVSHRSLSHFHTQLLTGSLTYSFTDPFTHAHPHSLPHSLPPSLPNVFVHSLTHSLSQSLTHSITHFSCSNLPLQGGQGAIQWVHVSIRLLAFL